MCYRLYFREFLSNCYGERDIQMDIQKISRYVCGELTLLAAALDISDEEVATIKSRCKNTQGQALQMLMKWQSSGTHSKQELVETLRGIGFIRAADMYVMTQCHDLLIMQTVMLMSCSLCHYCCTGLLHLKNVSRKVTTFWKSWSFQIHHKCKYEINDCGFVLIYGNF